MIGLPASTNSDRAIVLFGAGAHGRVALDILRAEGTAVRAFVDDGLVSRTREVAAVPVWSAAEFKARARPRETEVFVAIGNNDARLDLGDRLARAGFRLTNVIHPSAQVLSSARLGWGIFLGPLAVVGAGAIVHDGVVLNTRCTVDHDSVLARGAYLAPGVTTAGGVEVGEKGFVGLGALLGPNVKVGAQAVIGAGSVVLKSVPVRCFVTGAPARIVRRLSLPLDYRRLLVGEPGILEEVTDAA
jgi:sugar O-acyltransferase (sialic acid O-acetyltransferase NeuD family)